MRNVTRYNRPEAKLCKNNACVTVYDETAKAVNTIVVVAFSLIAIGYVAKALR